MKRTAEVIKVLIASPSDVVSEREAIPAILQKWNGLIGDKLNVFLQPVKWETHAIPLLAGRPQEILNSQFVRDADILIGIFWTRIGTHTGVAASGTVEEIKEFKESGKPVMLYFSEQAIPPSILDIEQYGKLKELKEQFFSEGIVFTYDTLERLNELIFEHLTRFFGEFRGITKFKNTTDKIIEKLEELNKRKAWGDLNEMLKEISDKKEYEDVCNFFRGRVLIYNPHLDIGGPEPHINSINRNSPFFIRGQKSLIYYHFVQYQDSNHPDYLMKIDEIAERIKGNDLVYYYFLKLKTINQNDFESCNALYTEFKRKCKPLSFDFDSNDFKTTTFSGPVIMNLLYPFQIPALNFYFLVHLLLKAHNDNRETERSNLLANVKGIYEVEKRRIKEIENPSSLLDPFHFEFRNFFHAEDEYINMMKVLHLFDNSFDIPNMKIMD